MKKRTIIWGLLALSVGLSAQPQASYYTSAALDGKNGRALELALQDIVYPHTKISYDDLWVAYETTDLAPVDSIPALYEGEHIMLVYDMYAWMKWFPKFYEDGNHSQTGGINREHCVPNSWFGGQKGNPIAYTDLHHLFPADGAANNAKQNYPLGEETTGMTLSFPTEDKQYNGKWYVTVANACSRVWNVNSTGASGGALKAFEPADMYKGDFARAYLYVVCAYEKKLRWQTSENTMFVGDSTTYTTIQPWALSLLLNWHRNDPVSEKEKVRNNAVESLQGNRNPFVDYPELVEYIWGNKTSESFSLATATCSYNSVYYEIHATNIVGGSVVAAPASAMAGQTVTLYATPDETHLFTNVAGNWSVTDGETPVSVTVGEGNSCTFVMPAGNVTVGATFEDNPKANHYLLREDFSSITTGNNTDVNHSGSAWTWNENFSAGTNVYQAGGAIRIGKGDATGSITTKTLDLSVNGGRFMVSFDVKGWTSVEGKIVVMVNGYGLQVKDTFTYTSMMDGEFETIQKVFEGGTAGSTITFATTSKRAFLDNIKVYYFRGMQEIEVSSVEWATYSTDEVFVMPLGLTGYTVSYEAGALSLNAAYTGNDVVPAGTPLLVHGNEGLYPYSLQSSSSARPENCIYPHVNSGTIGAVEGAQYYYKLLKPLDGPLGWYWGEESGGRFPLGDHKAYLALPASAVSAPSHFSLEGMVTGAEQLTEWQTQVDWSQPVYNVLGQRVAEGYVGIVIQGGTKYLAR